MAIPTDAPSRPELEDFPTGGAFSDETLYTGRHTLLLLGGMGVSFLLLLVLLFVIV